MFAASLLPDQDGLVAMLIGLGLILGLGAFTIFVVLRKPKMTPAEKAARKAFLEGLRG